MPTIPTGPDARGTPYVIVQELGQDPDGELFYRVLEYWDQRAAKDLVQPGLRKLYAKRDAVEWLLGSVAPLDDVSGPDMAQKRSQRFDHYQQLRQDLQTEILAVEARGVGVRAGAVGELRRTTPIDPLEPVPARTTADPNDRVYRGDPLLRRTTRW